MKLTAILTALALALGAFTATAADKVLERSAKKAPEWLHETPKGTILIEVERPTLGEAQAEAELELARRIISAVATNINYSTRQQGIERSGTDGNYSLEEFTSKTSTAAAKLPFLKGVSLSQATGTYWERREEKGSKRPYVVFAALYPLSASKLEEMTRQFEETDNAKSAELKKYKNEFGNVSSSDQIETAVNGLQALQAYFFDDVRLAEAKALESNYRQLYKGLALRGKFEGDNCLRVSVELNGRPFEVTGRPNVTSNCASQISVNHSPDGYSYVIKYSTEDCLANEENYLEFDMRIKNARLHDKFYFTME